MTLMHGRLLYPIGWFINNEWNMGRGAGGVLGILYICLLLYIR
jgi:hypothetical protein